MRVSEYKKMLKNYQEIAGVVFAKTDFSPKLLSTVEDGHVHVVMSTLSHDNRWVRSLDHLVFVSKRGTFKVVAVKTTLLVPVYSLVRTTKVKDYDKLVRELFTKVSTELHKKYYVSLHGVVGDASFDADLFLVLDTVSYSYTVRCVVNVKGKSDTDKRALVKTILPSIAKVTSITASVFEEIVKTSVEKERVLSVEQVLDEVLRKYQ